MRYAIAAIALGLSACAHTPDEPAIEVRTVEVIKPVPVACIDSDTVPPEPPLIGGLLTGNAARDADILAGSAIALRQWGRELMALVSPCTKSP